MTIGKGLSKKCCLSLQAEPNVEMAKVRNEEQDPDISLQNLAVMSILGEGGFGKVP